MDPEIFKMCKELGLKGKEINEFFKEREAAKKESEERAAAEAEKVRAEAEKVRAEAEKVREFELKKIELQLQSGSSSSTNISNEPKVKAPKLNPFIDGNDNIDNFLERFERVAQINEWNPQSWSTYLGTLLTGRALEVYTRISRQEAEDYPKLKQALLNRFNYTEDGYKKLFKESKPKIEESPAQYIERIGAYLDKWVELANVQKSYEGLRELCIVEQFTYSCPKELSVFLRERSVKNLHNLANEAESYLHAHGRSLSAKNNVTFDSRRSNNEQYSYQNKSNRMITCFNCHREGHTSRECKYRDNKQKDKDYQYPKKDYKQEPRYNQTRYNAKEYFRAAAAEADTKYEPTITSNTTEVDVCTVNDKSETKSTTCINIDKNIENDKLYLADGSWIHIMKTASSRIQTKNNERMPVSRGVVNNKSVSILRDSGCSGVVIKKELVNENQYTGDKMRMILIDKTIKIAPVAKIMIDSPYFKGTTNAICLTDALYDVIIGNIPGAKPPGEPNLEWTTTTAAGKIKAVNPISETKDKTIDDSQITREQLEHFQREDPTLNQINQAYKEGNIRYIKRKGILYKRDTYDDIAREKIVVPKALRKKLMDIAHDSPLGGHLGIKKTYEKISTNYYWPNIHADIVRYCHSCDVCQRTIPKGRVTKTPLTPIPMIDQPFRRIAVDIIGPIKPPSDEGHRYILTLVDYATRYPEAVPLKQITTQAVAEALVDIYCRLGIPDEILTDLGTQFTSKCMMEISNLLKIKQLNTTPYHPMCNGLVEKFNGTLKTMLKRLCREQPNKWHKFLGPLLFAYREAPQESTGFAPFELLYGRTIRGPLQIMKELWTGETHEPEIRNSYEYVFLLQEKLSDTMKIVREQLQKAQVKYKHHYDKRAKRREFKAGDSVLILLPTEHNKLLMQWKGPFPVLEKRNANNYKIATKKGERIYHANLLKLYINREEEIEKETECVSVAVLHDFDDDNNEEELGPLYKAHIENINDVKIGNTIRIEEREDLLRILQRYEYIFTNVPGTTHISTHKINLCSSEPVKSKPYPVPYTMREELKKEISSMIEMGIIRKSDSPYASPIVIVKKKDGTNRVCADFRKLNKITVFDPEPMNTTEELFAKLGQDKYFSKIDLSKGYWQIPMDQKDIPKTAFVIPEGHYEFLKMPFGLVNSGATLVRTLRRILDGMKNTDSFIDDLIIHTGSWDEHIKELSELLRRLSSAGFTIRPSKCMFAMEDIEFVGHSIKRGMKGLLEDNVKKIQETSRPTTKKGIRAFLGLTGYYREFVPNYAAIAIYLTELTKKGQPNKIIWTEAHEKAFKRLKEILSSSPVLKMPDINKIFILQTDASDTTLGAILTQEYEDKLFPVAYASKKLKDNEKKYSTMEKEGLAIIFGIKKFENYLYGKQFILQTDHRPLTYMEKAKFENPRIMRWAMILQRYKFKVESISGKNNLGADCLSRL
ncbi:UNVERIFIED_CONTAM: hypothetical protein RMT77_018226 [Armadillidium vulgare]